MEKEFVTPFEFLHSHPRTEMSLGINSGHVIVDKKDWEEARKLKKELKKFQGLVIVEIKTENMSLAMEVQKLKEANSRVQLWGNDMYKKVKKKEKEIKKLDRQIILAISYIYDAKVNAPDHMNYSGLPLPDLVKRCTQYIKELEKQVAVLIHESADSDQYINQLEQKKRGDKVDRQ